MMQPRRIAVLQLDNFQQSPFGKYFVRLAREFRSRGLHVDLLATSELGFDALPEGVDGFLIGQPRGRVPSHLKGVPELARYMRAKSPDAIIANGPPFAIAAVLAKMLSRSNVKILINLHTPISWEIKSGMARISRTYPFILPFVFSRAHKLIAVSDMVADDCTDVIGYPRNKIAIQPWFFVTDQDLSRAASLA